ncbi:M24 family metallopeptidase [Nordella sp. HKS 07]|uniref:M24 family metallopeptidase n=1 Tax=Nordella sp. HKS 07 TaxID=2712222 RepID=UPI0013E1E9F3|nr:M24 family metallopeptidase [Nordella sp. HKS 07]QIG51183.1 M24 family metallopeptidase [Nordella sp. HKS 07]
MPGRLKEIAIPEIGVPAEPPQIPPSTYERRCRSAYKAAGADWLIVYGDREHFANIMFLTGFDPRFEEALLVLGPGDRRIIVAGNECVDYAPLAGLPSVEIILAQSFGLMGQDRSAPSLDHVLRQAGMKTGDSMALAGWKYLEAMEWAGALPTFFVPSFIVDVLRAIAGDAGAVSDATPVLMHPTKGLRALIDADQIVFHEWAGSRASASLWRILSGVKLGDSEYKAMSRMTYEGEPFNVHPMLASGDASSPVVGLRSPSSRKLKRGDGIVGAIGLWGGLSARGGLLADHDDEFLKIALSYFEGLVAWYESADIGARGGDIFTAVTAALARGGLRSSLNPGHLTGHDEWLHSPIQPGFDGRISSGMPFQVDIIPVPLRPGFALNCEDPVVFADSALRAEIAARHPAVAERIAARRAFMREEIGIDLKETILPLSSTPLCLAPFWLKPKMLLACS